MCCLLLDACWRHVEVEAETEKREKSESKKGRTRCRYDQRMPLPCQRCFYTIMANYHEALEAVDRHIHSVRYDMVLESRAGDWWPSLMPHQVTYDVVATLIRPNNA
eukprot:scaffold205_cov102-Skeletonema_marinoi.AAC.2